MREFENVLPRTTLPQPRPCVVKAGDCGACVLGGLAGLSVSGAYGVCKPDGPSHFTLEDMQSAFLLLEDQGVFDRVVDEPPCWISHIHAAHTAFGFTALSQAPNWYDYVRLAIDAGYYGVVTISFEPVTSKPGDTYLSSNHWVMIRGARFTWVKVEGMSASRGSEEILVSCSVKGDYWIAVREFARLHGGSHVLLARPR